MAYGNQTLGRGEVHFSRFKADTQTPEGFRYLGNTPEFNLTIQTEFLDHYSSDRGIREKDKSIPLETSRTGSIVCDDIQLDNLAYFFFGSKAVLSQTAASDVTETIEGVIPGRSYQIGATDNNPTGVRAISGVSVTHATAATGTITIDAVPDADDTITVNGTAFTAKASGATGNQFNLGGTAAETAANLQAVLAASVVAGVAAATYSVENAVVTVTHKTPGAAGNSFTLATSNATDVDLSGGTLSGGSDSEALTVEEDYTLDLERGVITIVEDGAVSEGEDIAIEYDRAERSRTQVISGTLPIEGALKFVSYNPEGDRADYYMPYVKLSPNGDFSLKSDEWQQLPFTVEVLKATSREAIYIDGMPYTAS